MLPNYLVVPALAANIAVFCYLNADRFKTYVAGVRGRRMLNAYRVAGLMLVLVAVSHAKECTIKERQHVNCTPSCGFNKACVKRELASFETPFVAGVIRDSDYDEARAIAKSQGIDVSKWDAQIGIVQHSNGNDVFFNVTPEDQDWTNYFWSAETSKKHPKMAKALSYTWANAGALAILGILLFLVLQFSGASEHDATNVHEHLDESVRIMDGDYHGDDAFIVPDGMHSTYQSVPVRSRSAAAGR